MRKIAIYGKGGIGKSTTTSNLSIALSIVGNVTSGKNVLVIGEGVEACSFSDSLKKYGMVKAASALDIFQRYERAEYRLSDESEIKDVIGRFDVAVGDPCFRMLSGNTEFINRPMIAVSGGVNIQTEVHNVYQSSGNINYC